MTYTLFATKGSERFCEGRLDAETAAAHADTLATHGWEVRLESDHPAEPATWLGAGIEFDYSAA